MDTLGNAEQQRQPWRVSQIVAGKVTLVPWRATTGSRHCRCLQFEAFLQRVDVPCVVWPGRKASPGCVRQSNVLQIRSSPAVARSLSVHPQ